MFMNGQWNRRPTVVEIEASERAAYGLWHANTEDMPSPSPSPRPGLFHPSLETLAHGIMTPDMDHGSSSLNRYVSVCQVGRALRQYALCV